MFPCRVVALSNTLPPEEGFAEVERLWGCCSCMHAVQSVVCPQLPPSPTCPSKGLSKHGDPVFPHCQDFFWSHRFCGSNPIEIVVCSLVQVVGRVNMGVKVLVQL